MKLWALPLLLMMAWQTLAGSYYSSASLGGAITTSVSIEDKGIYNLVISVEFLTAPFDKAPFTSDNYEEMLKRLNVQWRGVVLKQVLQSSSYKMSDLALLKQQIDRELDKLVLEAKKKHRIKPNTEVIYAVGSFYLVNLNNE